MPLYDNVLLSCIEIKYNIDKKIIWFENKEIFTCLYFDFNFYII
jgi:hypothetical protein